MFVLVGPKRIVQVEGLVNTANSVEHSPYVVLVGSRSLARIHEDETCAGSRAPTRLP